MVRRARLQNVPDEEFVDRGPGKIKYTEGVSQEGEQRDHLLICVEPETRHVWFGSCLPSLDKK